MQFSTKAQTLKMLSGKVSSARILPLKIVKGSDKYTDPDWIESIVRRKLGLGPYVVRSSSNSEDTTNTSNAGAFCSFLSVQPKELSVRVSDVFESYPVGPFGEEVLIQPMLKSVVLSGVAFSHDPQTLSPYRVVNWYEGEDTTAITSGKSGYTWQQTANASLDLCPENIKPIVLLIEELEKLFNGSPIDLEFAITSDSEGVNEIWLLQVRPLVLEGHVELAHEQQKRIEIIARKIATATAPHPGLLGKRTIYGVMPDWNPAEIIGIRPKPLSLSLYRELVTDSIWAYQRHNYGYRNLRSFPLLTSFFGLPYIDVRVSFNSFIPGDLDDNLAEKLVDYYLDKLESAPELHDKIEFDIVFSAFTFSTAEKLSELRNYGFTVEEISQISSSLRALTNKVMDPILGPWVADAKKLDILTQRRRALLSSEVSTVDKIYWLLEDAKRYGTLPFAGLARAAFISVQFIKSIVDVGILSTEDYHRFLRSIRTVSGQLAIDFVSSEREAFLETYGHLRPGTYDISSKRYDEMPDLYFNWDEPGANVDVGNSEDFALTDEQSSEIEKRLKQSDIRVSVENLFHFAKSTIELREFSKFHFSKNLSDGLVLIEELGRANNCSREDMAYCDISVIRSLYLNTSDSSDHIRSAIQVGKDEHQVALKTALPPLICSPNDVYGFHITPASPNFITQLKVTADVINFCEVGSAKIDLNSKIVCIESADPGYDWLFSYDIAGLVTTWGGVNSHMAIRCGELGIPAIIGAGTKNFEAWSNSKKLNIDCASKLVFILS